MQRPNHQGPRGKKDPIVGQGRSLKDDEAAAIHEMIIDAQGSTRQLRIPQQDLHQDATTSMAPDVAQIVDASRIRSLLQFFNRDFLYGLGRFDEYDRGLLLKWGDGYSRKHIWITVEGENLVFEVSHDRPCDKPYCAGSKHSYPPDLWRQIALMNAELAEQFKRPVYERSDD